MDTQAPCIYLIDNDAPLEEALRIVNVTPVYGAVVLAPEGLALAQQLTTHVCTMFNQNQSEVIEYFTTLARSNAAQPIAIIGEFSTPIQEVQKEGTQ